MTTGVHEVNVDRPRPVVDVANQQRRRGDIIGALAVVLGGLPAFLLAFELITWNRERIAAYGVFLGLLTGAAMIIIARQDRSTALAVEAQVTPSSDPMSDAGTPLVPIADDGFED